MTDTVEPIVLVRADDPEKKPQLYACGKCGSVHSPLIYLAREEVQHATALDAARNCYSCKRHNNCQYCGIECHKGSLACRSCIVERQIEAAVEVPDDGGPYFGFDDDRMFHELEEAREEGHDWVTPCTETYPRLDADDLFENLTGDMYEDASTDDLVGTVEFAAAVKRFNDAQTAVTYWSDIKRKIRVPAAPEQPA